ncbi:MAG: hypothetical protein IKZ55_03010 [Bacteroidales bacterium]|nr:hypothetical protein [Bacteroidales bacterium]
MKINDLQRLTKFFPLIILSVFLCLMPLAARAQFTYNGGSYATLQAVFTAIGSTAGTHTITVTNNNGTFGQCGINVDGDTYSCHIRSGQTVNIVSDSPGTRRTIKRSDGYARIRIHTNGTLSMTDIIIDGDNVYTYLYQAMIYNASINTLTLENCVIKNSNGSHVGALQSGVDLTVDGNVRFEGNNAIGDGGGVFVGTSCETLQKYNATFLKDVTFVNCVAEPDWHWHSQCRGGGICLGGNLLICGNATFENCNVSIPWYSWNYGGGIYAGGNVEIRGNATFTGCEAGNGCGGAICALGEVTLSGSSNVFKRNKVIEGTDNTFMAKGGAIYCGKGGTISNTVIGGSADDANEAQDGGGIYLVGGNLTLNNCTVSHNKARTLYEEVNWVFYDHTTSYGGGIYVENAANLRWTTPR